MKTTVVPENPLGTQPIKSLVWKFAIPGIITQLVNSLHNIVDQVFLGWGIGDLGLAATNIVFPITTIIIALYALIGSGAAAKFSILLGEKKNDKAADVLSNAATLTVLIGVVLAAITSIFLKPMLYLFGATELILPYAMDYARIICLGIPFGIFSTAMADFIRADGNPNYSSFVLLAGAIFNIVFDPIFLFVFDIGMTGVALALTSLRYGTIIVVVAFLALQIFPKQILSLFNSSNPLFYEFAARYIHIYFAMLFLNAVQPITANFCIAIGKGNLGFWMALIRQGILLIPMLLLLPGFFGMDGVLFSGAISDGIAAVIAGSIAWREVKRLTGMQKAEKLMINNPERNLIP